MPVTKENSEALIIRNDSEGISNLILNRPKSYNALSISCMKGLLNEITAISEDPSIKVVIISGSGKGFCAGHDLKEMRANPEREFYEKTFDLCSEMMMSIINCPKPVIAKVHGIATAASCQLVSTCDLAVADENARFATPGVNIGLFCSTPMVGLSRNVTRKHAMEMLLTGDFISAQRAYEIGLVNRVVPEAELDSATLELANKIAAKSPLTLKIGKEAFYKQLDKDMSGAYEYCSRVMVENMMARDAEEGIDAFLEKRDPVWHGK
ncbi:MAG: enoyl-CoA hydratase [Thermodesulfobacteriales bacterium]|nr:MAG: enoyl-CoA hydratase [Thermodesulfobacteriales bacterium]